MKRVVLSLVAVAAVAGVVAFTAPASGQTDEDAALIGGVAPIASKTGDGGRA